LKQRVGNLQSAELDVARFTRAWIETMLDSIHCKQSSVARFTRAWIETAKRRMLNPARNVARFTRAWIETPSETDGTATVQVSPASRGRGLKQENFV